MIKFLFSRFFYILPILPMKSFTETTNLLKSNFLQSNRCLETRDINFNFAMKLEPKVEFLLRIYMKHTKQITAHSLFATIQIKNDVLSECGHFVTIQNDQQNKYLI